MNEMNLSGTISLLKKLNITPNKKLGQNFLVNDDVLKRIIQEAELSSNDIILEIGAGLGVLTQELAKYSREVHAYEIDSKLFQFLKKKFTKNANIFLYNEDILKIKPPLHDKIISNIPYTITGRILEKFFFKQNAPIGVLIVEKSIADRIFNLNNYKTRSRITIGFNAFLKPIKKFEIPNTSFYPKPNIELSLIKFEPKKNINPFLVKEEGRKFFLRFVAEIMPYKNKSMLNALQLFFKKITNNKIEKLKFKDILNSINLRNKKVFEYNVNEFINLSNSLYDYLKNLN